MRCRWVRRAIAGPKSRSSGSIGSRGCQGPLDVGSGSGQALRSGRVLRSFLRCVCTAAEEVRGAIGLALGHGVNLRSTGRSLTGRAKCRYRGSGLHMVIAPRAREASVQIYPLLARAGCQASSELCPVSIWDDRRASGQQLPDRSEDTRPGSSFLRLPLPGIRPGWPIRQNTKRTKTLVAQCGFHEHFGALCHGNDNAHALRAKNWSGVMRLRQRFASEQSLRRGISAVWSGRRGGVEG